MGKIRYRALGVVAALASLPLAVAGGYLAGPALADTYELNLDDCSGCLVDATPFSTVTITQESPGVVKFVLNLASDLTVNQSTAFGAFAFSLVGDPAITITPLSTNLSVGSTAQKMDGFGMFDYSVDYALNDHAQKSLSFEVSTLALNSPAFDLSSNPPGHQAVLFAADVFNTGNRNTGIIGGSTMVAVPEPATWTLMVLGFAGLGYAAFRKAGRESVSALA